jgi:streptogramin lyase
MTTMKRTLSTCVALAAVGLGPAVGQASARATAEAGFVVRAGSAVRLQDRSMSIAARKLAARSGRVSARLAVRLQNLGRRSLTVAASEFTVSAQGDVFGATTSHRRLPRVKIHPGRSGVVHLRFALPPAAMEHAILFYRPARTRAFAGIPLTGSRGAASSSPAQTGAIDNFPTVGGVGMPWGIAVDGADNVWFAEPGCDFAPTCPAGTRPGQIGEIKASSHAIVFFPLPDIAGNQPMFLTFDSSGKLWFTTPANSRIGEFDPATGRFVGQWQVTPGSGPWDLAFANGQLWYTEHYGSAVGVFDTATHAHRDFPTPSPGSNPYGIAAGGGRIWFTENNSSVDRVAVLDTGTNAISEYPIALPVSGTPHLIALDGNGHPWWTEGFANTIATLDPAVATPGQCGTAEGTCSGVLRFPAPAPTSCTTTGTHTSGIAIDRASQVVWFDNSLTAEVGSFNPSSGAFAMNALSDCNAHPHDGLALDGRRNVWFSQEFANAIGEVIQASPAAPAPAPPPASGTPAVAASPSVVVPVVVASRAQPVAIARHKSRKHSRRPRKRHHRRHRAARRPAHHHRHHTARRPARHRQTKPATR